MFSLAVKRARALARERRMPRTAADRRQLRDHLARLIRLPHYHARDAVICRTGTLSLHNARVGPWDIPMTVCMPPDVTEADLRVSDSERAAFWNRLPGPKRAVFVADLFGAGENQVHWSLQMLLECAGERVLGVQVAQILACADMVSRQTRVKRIHLVADGIGCAFAALVATALAPAKFRTLTVTGQIQSLSYLMELPLESNMCMGLFCFGLLQKADVPELKALLEDVTYIQPDRYVPAETPGRIP